MRVCDTRALNVAMRTVSRYRVTIAVEFKVIVAIAISVFPLASRKTIDTITHNVSLLKKYITAFTTDYSIVV